MEYLCAIYFVLLNPVEEVIIRKTIQTVLYLPPEKEREKGFK